MLTSAQKQMSKFLSKYKHLDLEVKFYICELENLSNEIDRLNSISLLKEIDKTNEIQTAIKDMQDVKEILTIKISKAIEAKKQIENSIELVNDEQLKNILKQRYLLHNKTWEQIAESQNISNQWVYKLHEKALKSIIEGEPNQ